MILSALEVKTLLFIQVREEEDLESIPGITGAGQENSPQIEWQSIKGPHTHYIHTLTHTLGQFITIHLHACVWTARRKQRKPHLR